VEGKGGWHGDVGSSARDVREGELHFGDETRYERKGWYASSEMNEGEK